jgi:hypothetical protein
MKKTWSSLMLALLLFSTSNAGNSALQSPEKNPSAQTGTLERMIIANGNVTMALNLDRLNGTAVSPNESKRDNFRWEVNGSSFFTIRVFNNLLRGSETGSMELVSRNVGTLPSPLQASASQLVLEKIRSGESFDLVVRDGKTGFVFFTVEGQTYDYDAGVHVFRINDGRLLISRALANTLGRPADAGEVVGAISVLATVYPIEVTRVVNGVAKSSILPGRSARNPSIPGTLVPGPDIVVGDMSGLAQFGSSGGQVGLAIATTSCNMGNQEVHFFQIPNTDHPVVSQNLYRMSGGANNNDRFEQIGQSWVKHTFGANQDDDCGFGCTPAADFTTLGAGCSDPYDAGENATYSLLGSRAWVNPFTGAFPANARTHTSHTHTGTSHRILVAANDLNTTMNAGATYYAEVQYDSPHEYAWCRDHPGECNMYNNASYRRYTVTGTTTFTFAPVGSTVRMTPATNAWTGATSATIEPEPGVDGRAFICYKVTNPSAGVWHYEYAIHNQNLDRAIQTFSVPLGCGINVSNPGFHAPPNHPGFANDGTVGNTGFSNAAWTSNQTAGALSWSSETFAQNQNANAIRFGTLYNFRFDSNRPPQTGNATIGFFKTGSPMAVPVQVPTATCAALQIVSAVSRKTHGDAGDFDIDLPLTGEPGVECRSSGGNHTLVVTFTNTMMSGNASVTSGVGSVAGNPTFSGNTMTIGLTGVADTQRITVTLNNATDSFSQVMADTAISVNMLAGDSSGNKAVNATDVSQTRLQSGLPVTAANFREDINASGIINATDVGEVKVDSGHSLP